MSRRGTCPESREALPWRPRRQARLRDRVVGVRALAAWGSTSMGVEARPHRVGAATCVVGLGGPMSAPRSTLVPGVDHWPTVTYGLPPRPCSPSGVPGRAPYWSASIQTARVYTAACLPGGRVSEEQAGHVVANSGRRSTTCRPGAWENGPHPTGSPSIRLRGGVRALGRRRGGICDASEVRPACAGVRRRTRPFP
jgi:hypothetical protein